ncbi:caM kinase-like vesicle-associated protein [Oxyura jamaicensis]|uniref:caM kinase-like vesicle-associated protein n=1 Tax=Oxyura jamaicensis TaxID=8884 RepID=UPI0015A5CAE4|nr:caM kinase-like vesicle-associated protein [Oxyura jamaicensis]
MEVEQDQRITAEEAISHEWISGNAASDKNIKDGVCAQIEKNFARAKWKKAVRVTTLMKRLRAPEQTEPAAAATTTAAATAATDAAAPPAPTTPPAATTPAPATCNGDSDAAAATEAPNEPSG